MSFWDDIFGTDEEVVIPDTYETPDKVVQGFAKSKAEDILSVLDEPNLIPTLFGESPKPSLLDMGLGAAELAANLYPSPVSDALSAKDAVEQFSEGDYGWGALSALGAMPLIPNLGIFAGKLAKTADLDALAKAERAVAEGWDDKSIRESTGWFRYPGDDEWRFEIPDTKLKVDDWYKYRPTTAGNAIYHPKLFEAYPQLKDSGVFIGDIKGAKGSYDPTTKNIEIAVNDLDEMRSTAAHELQHAVQDIEGFGKGGSAYGISHGLYSEKLKAEMGIARINKLLRLSDPVTSLALMEERAALLNRLQKIQEGAPTLNAATGPNLYMKAESMYPKLAGEVEARLVQKRLNNPSLNPLDDLDTPIEDILRNPDYSYSSLIQALLQD
jgi:hypothetical protein